MQLANRAKKFFYLGCLILILGKLSSIPQPQKNLYWQRSQQILTKLYSYWHSNSSRLATNKDYALNAYGTQPLVMRGGDPYIRALMRTITASEANVTRPYHVIYGGKQVDNLERHPELCVTIVAGPNRGNCTTAAGRYQMLDFTWSRTARRYHPNEIDRVLRLLSGTWTSLGYGIETNSMSDRLPRIYQNMLQEELG